MSDTSQIFTDSRVTITVTLLDTSTLPTALPIDPVPTESFELHGVVQWVDHNDNTALVHWTTGGKGLYLLDDLTLEEQGGPNGQAKQQKR